MYNFRKALASLSVVAILSTLVVSTAASAGQFYDDVPDSQWFSAYVNELAEAGILDTTKKTFNPGANLNRAEAVKLLVEAFELEGETAVTFKDVKSTDWYYGYVKTAVANGVVSGYADNTFGGAKNINRAEWAKVVVIAADLPECEDFSMFSDVKAADWFAPYAATAYCNGVMAGKNGKFAGGDLATRAEAAKMISVAMNPEPPEEDDDADDDDDDDVSTGDLTVSLGDTPAGVTLPKNATSTAIFEFDVAAGSDDVKVNSITFHKTGVSTLATDFQGYIYEGSDRLTNGKSFNSTTQDMVFTNLGLTVPKGGKKTLTLKVDVGATAASGSFQVQVSKVDSNAADVEGLPVTSEEFGVSTTAVGTITIAKNGTVTNPKVGEDGVTIAKFKLTADSEAAKVKEFGLYLAGTINTTDVQNLKLYVSGTTDPLATVDGVNGRDVAQFVLATPYEIEKGGTKSFWVTADLNTGRNADTLRAYIDENTDVVAIGGTYGFGMAVTKGDFDNGADNGTDASWSTLEGGDITISSGGPASTDVAVNSKDVQLLAFNVTSVANVTFKNFAVGLDASENAAAGGLLSSSTANFTDIKVINTKTGETLMGPVDVTSFTNESVGSSSTVEESDSSDTGSGTDADQAYYLFTDEFTMDAGESLDLALTADIANNTSLNTDTLVASLQIGSTYPQVKDVNNKTLTNSSSLVPSSVITGKTMTVKSSSLTLSRTSTPVTNASATTNTKVKGTDNVQFVGVNFACGSSSSCKITDLTLTGYLDDNGNASAFSSTGTGADHSTLLNSYVGSVRLEDGAGKVIVPAKSVQSNGTVVFNNLALEIKAGETLPLYVVGKLSTNSYANGNAENITFGISSTSNVTAEDAAGNAIATVTGTVNTSHSATTGTYVTTSAGGSLTVAVDSTTPKEEVVVAGTADQEISRFKFTTTDESFVVKKLAINNRQSGVAAANIGNYDNNVKEIKISYTNSLGATETKTTTLSSGTGEFSGLDMFIDKDKSATLKVYATLNTISGGATAAEYVDLNLAFENFEALASGSGETYNASKLDDGTAASSDLDFGTMSFTTTGVAVGTLNASMVAGTAMTITTADLNASLPIGTLVKFGADSATYTEATEPLVVLTSVYTDGDLTLTGFVANDDADGNEIEATDTVYYALPGTGYLTAANRVHVYKSKPTLSLAGNSPSGGHTASGSDTIMEFSIAANPAESIVIRQGLGGDDENDVNDVVGIVDDGEATITTASGDYVDGSGGIQVIETAGNATTGMFLLDETYSSGAINGYDFVSFWMKVDEADNDSDVDFADLNLILDDDTTPDAGTAVDLGSTSVAWANGLQVTSGQEFTDDTWVFFTLAISGAVDADDQVGFHIAESTEIDASDEIFVDGLVFHNEMLMMDLRGNASLDLTPTADVMCSLKDGSTTLATAGVGVKTTSLASLQFVPVDDISGGTDYTEIEISGTKTYSVVCNTTDLISQSVNNDSLTPEIVTGSASDSTVTRGYFWWSANETTKTLVYWLGNVVDVFKGNTLNY